jgi:hypothetical protein
MRSGRDDQIGACRFSRIRFDLTFVTIGATMWRFGQFASSVRSGLALSSLALCGACAKGPVLAPHPSGDRGAAKTEQPQSARAVPSGRSAAAPTQPAEPPPASFDTLATAARQRAVAAAKSGDMRRAEEELRDLADAADAVEGDAPMGAWQIQMDLVWLRWADGDFPGARARLDGARSARYRAHVMGNMSVNMRVDEQWAQAFVEREAAEAEKPALRAERLAMANVLRRDLDEAAVAAGRQFDLAVLDALFAVRARDAARALAAAKSAVHLGDEPGALQSYVLALAFDLGRDRAHADAIRQAICAREDDVLKLVIVGRLKADAAHAR